MKTRWKRWIIALAVIAVLALLGAAAASFVLRPSPVVLAGKGKSLGKDLVISAQAGPRESSVRKGDAFPFLIEVLYDATQIASIDRASLDQAVNFKPFESRGFQETDFQMDERVRVYRREYELQFIDGKVGQAYDLPTIVVRYQLKNANGFAEKAVVPSPINVGSRLPAEVGDLELRPITDKIQDPSRDRFIAVLWAGSALLLVVIAVDLFGRVLPQWREQAKQRRRIEEGDVLVQAYRSLNQQVALKAETKVLCHQVDHILRLVLGHKADSNWLEEPDLGKVAVEIRPLVATLFETCQQSYGRNGAVPVEAKQTVEQLDQVLRFYYGVGEVEAWRN